MLENKTTRTVRAAMLSRVFQFHGFIKKKIFQEKRMVGFLQERARIPPTTKLAH